MAYCYRNRYGRTVCRSNRWGNWGRWVLLGLIILAALFMFFMFACISARRRRKFGHKPFMGTGWAAPGTGPFQYNSNAGPNTATKPGHVEQGYYGNQTSGPGVQDENYGPNQGYYGTPTQQAPAHGNQSHGGNNAQSGAYQPPSYPPPSHQHDGIVR